MGEPKQIPAHESLVRRLLSDVKPDAAPYKSLQSMEDARETEHGALVIEGDWGGTIYLSCPVKYINATQEEITALAEWLERQFWDCNFLSDNEGGHHAYYEVAPPGKGVMGGMGGGRHVDGLWVHDDIAEELGDEIIKRLKLEKP